jgi:hypothetical protein
MSAIDNIRRDLNQASYLKYSPVPFAGAIHDFTRTLPERLKRREYTGPYYWNPTQPGKGRGFYQSSKGLYCDKSGSTFDLRLEEANDHLSGTRLAQINGYYCDQHQDETLQPIIARLPHGRGFLAGWTMGRGMFGSIDCDIYETAEEAAYAAHSMAEHDAETSRETNDSEEEGI